MSKERGKYIMSRALLYLISILILAAQTIPRPALASPVYAGCSPAVSSPTGNVWYVDPVNGSMQGDGSQAHPWQTLSGVIDAALFANMPTHWNPITKTMVQNNPNAPIQSGDTIYLMSGNHGVVNIQGNYGNGLIGYNNTAFITIAAAPGQTPIFQQLILNGGNRWIFRGITIQSVNNTGTYSTASNGVPDVFLVTLTGPHQDIVLDGNIVTSTPNIASWGISDWISLRSSAIKDGGGVCVSMTNNMIRNVGFGMVTQSSDQVLMYNNVITRFTDDGIDFGSSDLLIQNNRIYNSVEDGDGFHRDGMQGQPVNEQSVANNVSILNNTVIRVYNQGTNYPGYLQGIDAFDGIWNNLTVNNNIVITDAYDGIAFYGTNNAVIQGNDVLADAGLLLPCFNLNLSACLSQVVGFDTSTTPLIVVHSAKSGVPSTNVVVNLNIMTGLQMDPNDPAVTVTDNLCVPTASPCAMLYLVGGTYVSNYKTGVYSGNNVVSAYPASGLFQTFNTSTLQYNLTLLQPNPAAGN